jgi:hypothetical protein
MKGIAVFMLFIGMFLVVQGYYAQSTACPEPKIQIKYVPRSLYEEQLSDNKENPISKQFRGMFEDLDPLLELERNTAKKQDN